MNTQFHVTKVTAILAVASLAFTVATASVASAAGRLLDSGNVAQTGVLIGGGGGGPIGPSTEPDDSYSKPRTPGQPYQVGHSDHFVKLRWTDNSSYELGYNVYRGASYNGPWTQIAAYGAASGNTATMEHLDAGLPRDSGYYYRIGAYNYYGESFSIPQVLGTINGRVQVSRLQVRLRTANVTDANTDDSVHVSVNDYNMNYGTWLDYGRNDFERGDEFLYELMPEGVSDLSHINNIYIFKTGSNGWCINSLALLVNGGEIYTEQFSPCRWLDNNGNNQNHHVIGRDALRAHPLWQSFLPPLRTSIPKLSLGDLIEGTVGNIIHDDISIDSPVYVGDADPDWGRLNSDGRAVTVSRKDSTAVSIRFNLDVDVLGPDNLDVDLSFDVRLAGVCRTATSLPAIRPTVENINASSHVTSYTLPTAFFIQLAAGWADDMIENNLKNFLPKLENDFPVDVDQVDCIIPSVNSEGNIDFTLTFVPKTGGTNTTGTGTIGGTKATGTGVLGGTKIGGTFTQGTGTIGTETEGTIPTKLSKPTSRTFIEE